MHMDAPRSVSAALLLAMLATFCCGQSGLEKFSKCSLGNDFEIVKVDRLHTPMSRTVDTPSGSTNVVMIDGLRILIAYNHDELFVNLKAEQLEKLRYPADKQTLIDSLGLMAERTPDLEANKPSNSKLGRFEGYGINRTKLECGVLSVYMWFDDASSQVLTAYILNDEPADRKFQTIGEYRELRNRFLQKLSSCSLS